MQYVHFLNFEYFIVRTYQFLLTLREPALALPSWALALVHGIVYTGMGLSLVLLILVIYAHIRMVETEHAGFHALEEESHEEREHEAGPEGETRHRTRWDDIVTLASSGSESDWRRAILEADIMLSDALRERGFEGATVADQLRMANPIQMRTLDLAWQAHKMRNRVAHDGERLDLTDRDVRAAIDQFKRVFEEFGII